MTALKVALKIVINLISFFLDERNRKKFLKIILFIIVFIIFLFSAIINFPEIFLADIQNEFTDFIRSLTGNNADYDMAFPIAYSYTYTFRNDWGESREGGKRTHKGIDIPANKGVPCVAVQSGKIILAGWAGTGGYTVKIKSDDYTWVYHHLSIISDKLEVGDKVKMGQYIGQVGNTGKYENGMPSSFGNHLHIGKIDNKSNEYINPYNDLKKMENNKWFAKVKKSGLHYVFNGFYDESKKSIKSNSEFVETLKDTTKDMDLRDNHQMFRSVCIGQACLESGFGTSGLARKDNNLFGIKDTLGDDWDGPYAIYNTKEYDSNGNLFEVQAAFRKYNDWGDSIEDWAKFLHTYSRYEENGVFSASTYKEQVQALKNAGYATDINYVSKVIDIINKYKLYQLD
jgi:hypothetical protein